jgi:predicted RNase H-like nuclease (RuvC/YqgF family)
MDLDWNMILTMVLTAASSVAGYLFGRRRNEAETDKIVLDNVKDILMIYSDVIDDLKNEVKELKDKILEYEEIIGKLTREINTLRSDMKKNNKVEKPD